MTYLHKHAKTHVYYHRRIIPDDIRHAFKGSREYKRSLQTKDLREAKRRNAKETVKSDALFERMRQSTSLSMDDAMALARKRWTEMLQEDAEERASSPEYHKHPQDADDLVPQADEFQHILNEYRAALSSDDARCPDYSLAYFEVRRIIETEQLPITDESSEPFQPLAYAFLRLGVHAIQQLIERERGHFREDAVVDFTNQPAPSQHPAPGPIPMVCPHQNLHHFLIGTTLAKHCRQCSRCGKRTTTQSRIPS